MRYIPFTNYVVMHQDEYMRRQFYALQRGRSESGLSSLRLVCDSRNSMNIFIAGYLGVEKRFVEGLPQESPLKKSFERGFKAVISYWQKHESENGEVKDAVRASTKS